MVIVESPERPSTAGKQLGCQLVEMISKEAVLKRELDFSFFVTAGGPPALTSDVSFEIISTS